MGTVCHASENSMRELLTLNITDKIDTVQFANGPVEIGGSARCVPMSYGPI